MVKHILHVLKADQIEKCHVVVVECLDTLDSGHGVTFRHSRIHHKQPEELWDGYFDIPPPALALATQPYLLSHTVYLAGSAGQDIT